MAAKIRVASIMIALALIGLLSESVALAAPYYAVTPLGFENANGINDNGQIVGQRHSNRQAGNVGIASTDAVLWEGGKVRVLEAPPDAVAPAAMAVSNNGIVAGETERYSASLIQSIIPPDHALVWRNGTVTSLPSTSALYDDAKAISVNDKEQILVSGIESGYLWQQGVRQDFGSPPGVRNVFPAAINNAGEVVGGMGEAGNPLRAFLWSKGNFTDLGLFVGSKGANATAINNKHQVAGNAETGSFQSHAFLWQKGRMTDLNTLAGDKSSSVNAINDQGQIVGSSNKDVSYIGGRAVLWEREQIYDLNSLVMPGSGWSLVSANGINNRGQIVGTGSYHGKPEAFLLTPVKR